MLSLFLEKKFLQSWDREYEIDQFEAVDIDTAEDFEFAKAVAAYLEKKEAIK